MWLHEDIAIYLATKGLVAGYGIDCFGDTLPTEPDNVVSLQEYAGEPFTPYVDVVHRSLQVLVRNTSPEEAKGLANNIHKALQSPNLCIHFTTERFGQVYLRQTPFKLKEDENDRVIYCFNIGITTTID